jgi:hypothetical protein
MTDPATTTPPPVGIYYRPHSRRPWALIDTAPTDQAARSRMFDLMGRRSGDWTTAPVGNPPGRRKAEPAR